MLSSISQVSSRSFARVVPKATLIDGAFSFADMKQVEKIFAKYPPNQKRAAIIPLLHLAQEQNGFINTGVISEISKLTGSLFGKVHETASFYSMFRFTPPKKHIIEVCRGLSCYVNNGDKILKVIKDAAKNSEIEVTTSECLGACANAPVMVVDGVYYQNLTEKEVKEIVKRLKKGKSIEQFDAIHTPPAKPKNA